MASLQVASPQVEEEVCSNAEELQTVVMTPPVDIYDIDKPVHLNDDDDDDDIEIIPRRDQGKQVEDLDEEDVNQVKPASQFDQDEPANKDDDDDE